MKYNGNNHDPTYHLLQRGALTGGRVRFPPQLLEADVTADVIWQAGRGKKSDCGQAAHLYGALHEPFDLVPQI